MNWIDCKQMPKARKEDYLIVVWSKEQPPYIATVYSDGLIRWDSAEPTHWAEIEGPGEHDHSCHCGTASRAPHETGTLGCVRFITESPVHVPPDRWLVDGGEITDFTLRQQRGYHRHPCGCWSRWPGSSNSIEDPDPPPPDPFAWETAWRKYRPPGWNLADQQYFQAGWNAAIKHAKEAVQQR